MRRAVDLLVATSIVVVVAGWWWFESSAPSDADRTVPVLITAVVIVFTAPATIAARRQPAGVRHVALAAVGQVIAVGFFRLLEPSWPAAIGALVWLGGAVALVAVADEVVQHDGLARSSVVWGCSVLLAAALALTSAAGGPDGGDGARPATWSWIEWVPNPAGADGMSVRRWQMNPFAAEWVSSEVAVGVVWFAWSALVLGVALSSLVGVLRHRGVRWSIAHIAVLAAMTAQVVAAWPERLDVVVDDSPAFGGWYAELLVAVPAFVALGLGVGAAWRELVRTRVMLVGDDVLQLSGDSSPEAVRHELGATLGDPTVRLLFPDTRTDQWRWLDEAGDTCDLADDPHRAAVIVANGGHLTAAVEHDISLTLQPDLVDLAATTASLSLERRRLAALAERDAADARASATRLLVAEEESRAALREGVAAGPGRRLEQARWMLQRPDPDFESVHDEVRAAVAGIRALSRGEQPPSLREHGLVAALRDLAGETGVSIEIEVPHDRLVPADESTIYIALDELARSAASNATRRLVGRVALDGQRIELCVDEPCTQLSAVTLDRIDTLGGSVYTDDAVVQIILPDARLEPPEQDDADE